MAINLLSLAHPHTHHQPIPTVRPTIYRSRIMWQSSTNSAIQNKRPGFVMNPVECTSISIYLLLTINNTQIKRKKSAINNQPGQQQQSEEFVVRYVDGMDFIFIILLMFMSSQVFDYNNAISKNRHNNHHKVIHKGKTLGTQHVAGNDLGLIQFCHAIK